jgi:hypothetical protein
MLAAGLDQFEAMKRRLPGIRARANRATLIEQLVESIRRIRYVHVIADKRLSPATAEPNSDAFDPIKAAVRRIREEQFDEAFWFVFLSVHFGKNRFSGWRLARNVYAQLGRGHPWDWASTSCKRRSKNRPHHAAGAA